MASTYVSHTKTASFDSDVLKSDASVVVDFWAPWCGPCKMLAPLLDDVATEQAGKVKIVKVNIDEEPDLAQKYGIRAIPTLVFFKGGEKKDEHVGMMSKKDLVDRLGKLL